MNTILRPDGCPKEHMVINVHRMSMVTMLSASQKKVVGSQPQDVIHRSSAQLALEILELYWLTPLTSKIRLKLMDLDHSTIPSSLAIGKVSNSEFLHIPPSYTRKMDITIQLVFISRMMLKSRFSALKTCKIDNYLPVDSTYPMEPKTIS